MSETLEQIIARAKSKTPCASNYECLLADLMGLAQPSPRAASEALDYQVEIALLRGRLRTIHLAETFSGNAEVVKRIAELENTSDQARQYIQNAQEREHRINELESALAAATAERGEQ